MTFELINKDIDNWTRTQFWERDSMQSEQLCRICLWVDWRDETCEVETVMHTNSYPVELHNGVCSRFNLPQDTDFTEFPKFLREEIISILDKLHVGFDHYWNGSNWRGSFDDDVRDLQWTLEQALQGAPTHDMQYYLSLRDLYGDSGSHTIVSDLKEEGIDLSTADLDNDGVMSLAVEIVTYGDDSDYKLIGVDVEDELRNMQKELQEEQE